jgi:hypothetical protein
METIYVVTHLGEPVAYVEGADSASTYVLKHQAQSVEYALRWGGWAYGDTATGDTMTHHLRQKNPDGGPGVCVYCGKTRSTLVYDIGGGLVAYDRFPSIDVTQYRCAKWEDGK